MGDVPPEPAPRRPSLLAAGLTTYGTHITVAILSLANVLLVARDLGPTGRGNVAFLTTVGTLVAYLSNLGINQANANFAASRPATRPALATNSLLFALGLGGAGAGVVAALIAAFPGVGGEAGWDLRALALASVPVIVLQTYLANLVQADYRFGLANLAWLASPVTNVAANGVLVLVGALTVGRTVAVWVGGWALATAILVWYTGRRHTGFGRPDRALARSMLGFGLKAHGGRILMVGNYRLDQWLVGTMAGPRELGLYSVAVAWAEGLFLLPTALTTVQRPDLVRSRPREAARQAARVLRVALLATAFFAAVLIVAAPFLCETIFGERFAGSVDDLRLLALGGFGIATLKLLGQTLTAQRKPMLETAAIGVAFLLGLALDLALIPTYGGAGAAVAATAAYTAGGAAVTVIFLRALGGRALELVPRPTDVLSFVRR